jgi:hypothetical protein
MTDEKPTRRGEGPIRQYLRLIAAVGLWVVAIVARTPAAFVVAALWTLIAVAAIWRLTHAGEPIAKRWRSP